jgi:response regulator RpfG family c-di-GMP phosphodiesterase
MRDPRAAKVLVLDDQVQNLRLVESALRRAGFGAVSGETDPVRALTVWKRDKPDLLILDLDMPKMNGFDVLQTIQEEIGPNVYFPVLILTADISREAKQRALKAGAKDFISKPFDTMDLVLRSTNLIQTRFLHLQIASQNEELEARVKQRTMELEEAQRQTLERLALAAEYRDDDTGQHTRRVGNLSAALARELSLPAEEVDIILDAAPLHDVGKIGIPDSVLLKPGRLTAEEFEQIKTHTRIGAELLRGTSSSLLQAAEEIARSHHEKWNGTGYEGLSGTDIPLHGRLVSVADVFDALTHARPYKGAWTVEDAIAEIVSESGHQFDPAVVEALVQIIGRGTLEEVLNDGEEERPHAA